MRRLLPLLVLIGLAACGEAGDQNPPAAAGAPGRLPVGRGFVATGASEGGRDRPLVAPAGIEFLTDGRTLVRTGCNGAQGVARLSDGRLETDGLAVNEMACLDEGVTEQQTFVLSVVEGSPEVLLGGDELVLRTAAAEIRFLDEKVAVPDRPLEGTRWEVNTVFDAQVAGTVAAPASVVVLSAGRVRVTGPCHDHKGAATVTGETVVFGPLTAGPARPCNTDQQRSEAEVVRALAGSVRAAVRGKSLRLTGEDGGGLVLGEAPAP